MGATQQRTGLHQRAARRYGARCRRRSPVADGLHHYAGSHPEPSAVIVKLPLCKDLWSLVS